MDELIALIDSATGDLGGDARGLTSAYRDGIRVRPFPSRSPPPASQLLGRLASSHAPGGPGHGSCGRAVTWESLACRRADDLVPALAAAPGRARTSGIRGCTTARSL